MEDVKLELQRQHIKQIQANFLPREINSLQIMSETTISGESVVKMFFHKSFWFLLTLMLNSRSRGDESPFRTCTRYTSFGYGYRDFFEFQGANFPPNLVFYLEFYVKTNSDAHILLKSDMSAEQGYEIVIGGGSNTFSQIRLLEPEVRKTMITQKTENFLSGVEYKYFWISINKLGIISVGKKENDEVFINWRFDEPLPIKYYSFGSWTNMKADWRFGCSLQNDSEVIHEDGALSPEKKLKRDLFTLYDPNALPVEKGATLEVKVNFQINKVQLNEKRGELTMYGTGDLKWLDGKLKWNKENYNGIENLYVPPYQIWTPSIRVLNALAMDRSPLFDLTTAGVEVRYDGSIFWRPPFTSKSHCAVDLKYWPNDSHNCTVLFGFWLEPPNLVLSMTEGYDTVSEEITESEWQIEEVSPYNTKVAEDDENYGILYVVLERSNGPLNLILTVPYIAAVIFTLTSFWVPLQSSVKMHLMCLSVVILFLSLVFMGHTIPALTKSTPEIINIYTWTMVVTCVPILLTVILKNIFSCVHVPDALARILSNNTMSSIFCLPDYGGVAMEYSNFSEDVNKVNRDTLNALRLVTVINRIFFFLYFVAIYLII